MSKFKLISDFAPTQDQKNAIAKLTLGVRSSRRYQTLLGVTGSGKTFTMANVIANLQRPSLVISHNKTLAAQLYQELKSFFPENAVSFFVSYYDYYQPEAYIPQTDTYIEKDADINEKIDRLRLEATTNILTRADTIIVASVSCIYNIGSPKEYGSFVLEIRRDSTISREKIISTLVSLQYERSDFGFNRATFRVRGDVLDIFPAYLETGIRVELSEEKVQEISEINPTSGNNIRKLDTYILYPAKHYITDPTKNKKVFGKIRKDLATRTKELISHGKNIEAYRLKQKVNWDLEMIEEMGYVKGIENYSRYFDGRLPGQPPYTLLDYFEEISGRNWNLFIDESHMSFPQLRGMYNGDLSRKETLINYGFRLPAALDNRPLKFEEFMRKIPGFIAMSATPAPWEISMSEGVVEQLLRPTGIPDPKVAVKPLANEVDDAIHEIQAEAKKGGRTLVTTLTKKTAEDLAEYLNEKGLKVHYLHSDIKTLERTTILDDLRMGKYDCLIGINLLREGLDLPEVTLVCILDADKEGFLRNDVTLIQTMGRAARHAQGRVILYADRTTSSIRKALTEVKRRRAYQLKMNKKYGTIPTSITKPVREKLIENIDLPEESKITLNLDGLTPYDKRKLIVNLKREMRIAANDLNFELAAQIRDRIREIEL